MKNVGANRGAHSRRVDNGSNQRRLESCEHRDQAVDAVGAERTDKRNRLVLRGGTGVPPGEFWITRIIPGHEHDVGIVNATLGIDIFKIESRPFPVLFAERGCRTRIRRDVSDHQVGRVRNADRGDHEKSRKQRARPEAENGMCTNRGRMHGLIFSLATTCPIGFSLLIRQRPWTEQAA